MADSEFKGGFNMRAQNEKLFELFFRYFNRDDSKFLLPRLPYTDDFQHRRVMDYAIISQDPGMPKVAILIRPDNSYQNKLREIELENALRVLKQLGWVPLVFTSLELEVGSEEVREQLEEIFSINKTVSRKVKPKNVFGNCFKGFSFTLKALSCS
jgi:hypothetical protein